LLNVLAHESTQLCPATNSLWSFNIADNHGSVHLKVTKGINKN